MERRLARLKAAATNAAANRSTLERGKSRHVSHICIFESSHSASELLGGASQKNPAKPKEREILRPRHWGFPSTALRAGRMTLRVGWRQNEAWLRLHPRQ
jgi:hypothetical protein